MVPARQGFFRRGATKDGIVSDGQKFFGEGHARGGRV